MALLRLKKEEEEESVKLQLCVKNKLSVAPIKLLFNEKGCLDEMFFSKKTFSYNCVPGYFQHIKSNAYSVRYIIR